MREGEPKPPPEVLEVEVERLPEGTDGSYLPPEPPVRVAPRVGPLAAGVLIDLLDLVTFRGGPLALVLGALAGYPLGRALGMSRASCVSLALLVGLYCALPLTPRIPLATLVGLYARLFHRR